MNEKIRTAIVTGQVVPNISEGLPETKAVGSVSHSGGVSDIGRREVSRLGYDDWERDGTIGGCAYAAISQIGMSIHGTVQISAKVVDMPMTR